MRMLVWIAAGLTAGLPGAATWVAAAYFAGVELAAIAAGIGALSALGVRLLAKDAPGRGPEMAAVIACLLAMGAAKLGHTIVSWPGTEGGLREGALMKLCTLVTREHQRAGRPVELPTMGWETRHTDYPEEISAEAKRRWDALAPEEQAWYLRDVGHVFLLDEELTVAKLALNIVGEHAAKGAAVNWPPAANRHAPRGRDDFPEEIWQEALNRWERLSPEERREFEEIVAFAHHFGSMIDHIFTVFSVTDCRWFAFAALAAWGVAKTRTGSRRTGDDRPANGPERDLL